MRQIQKERERGNSEGGEGTKRTGSGGNGEVEEASAGVLLLAIDACERPSSVVAVAAGL